MAYLFAHFQIDDFDAWKNDRFDADPAGRKEAAKAHVIYRGADDPSQVYIAVEFESTDQAQDFRRRLLDSGALDAIDVKTQPTVVDVADQAQY